MLNEFFIYSEDISPSPGYFKGWKIFRMTAFTKKPFKNSYSKNLRIVNAVVMLIPSRSKRLTEIYFSSHKATHFLTVMQLWMKWTMTNQRYWMNLFFVAFQSFVLLPNSMTKLIDNQCTCKLIKTKAAYVYAHEKLRLCFYVLARYYVVLDIHHWKFY